MAFCGVFAVVFSRRVLPKLFCNITDGIVISVAICIFVLCGVLVLLLMSRKINKKEVLLVLFLKNKVSAKVANNIKSLVESSVNNIESEYDNVKIIVPPIGLFGNKRKCYRYIANPLTRGDVYVMAEVFDGDDDNSPNYVFKQFYSQTNKCINNCKYIIPHSLLNKVNTTLKYSDWNYRQDSQNDIASKIRMSGNIEMLLMLYVSSTFMIKNNFTEAISFVNKIRNSEYYNDVNFRRLSDALLGDSHLLISQNEEHENHDYNLAFEHLTIFASLFPAQKNNPMYVHAMARVLYYKGDIKESKRYTKTLRNLKGGIYKWGYELNMGFYAICEGKVSEFVQHYKNLRRYEPYDKQQIQFVIVFLKEEHDRSLNPRTKMLLSYAIAYLYQYIKIKKAKMLLAKTKKTFSYFAEKELIVIENIIMSSDKKWIK